MTVPKPFVETVKSYIDDVQLSLPLFDPVAMRVQMELIKKEPDVRKVEKIIVSDQALSSNILKVANSSRFSGLVKTTTVRSAIVRLGLTEIGNIVLLDLHRKHYLTKIPEYQGVMKELWQHSVGCAFVSGWLSRRLDFGVMQNEAFFAGLFHDVGKLYILAILEQEHSKGRSKNVHKGLLLGTMNLLHQEAGTKFMHQLGLSEIGCYIAGHHHEKEFDKDNYLLVLVRMANRICHKMGIGLKKEEDLDVLALDEAQQLGLTPEDLDEIVLFLESTPSLA